MRAERYGLPQGQLVLVVVVLGAEGLIRAEVASRR